MPPPNTSTNVVQYRLTNTDVVVGVTTTPSGVQEIWIPNDPANNDRIAYEKWLADGGVPDPYVEPPPPPPTEGEMVAFDHENRIRTLEGEPPLTMSEFVASRKTLKP